MPQEKQSSVIYILALPPKESCSTIRSIIGALELPLIEIPKPYPLKHLNNSPLKENRYMLSRIRSIIGALELRSVGILKPYYFRIDFSLHLRKRKLMQRIKGAKKEKNRHLLRTKMFYSPFQKEERGTKTPSPHIFSCAKNTHYESYKIEGRRGYYRADRRPSGRAAAACVLATQ